MIPTAPDGNGSSTRPYLIRALHDWCTDNGFTPYVAVLVDASVQVPGEYVKDNEIVLNVGFEATSGMKLGNEFIEFKARFAGVSRDIMVPVDHVIAIYARENGQGMAFPAPTGPYVPGDTAAEEAGSVPQSKPAGGGLRLASADGQTSPRPEGVDDDSDAEHKASRGEGPSVDDDGESPPEPPTAPTGGRPALKRVK